jgi:hypothetical protein
MKIDMGVALALAAAFALLSALHVVWAFGGKIASGSVIPVINGAPVFRPSVGTTLAVAGLLAAAALVVLVRAGILLPSFPPRLATFATVVLGAILVLRAIGDFRLVGFFKSLRGTAFARWDNWLYSPLSLALGLAALWLASTARAK